MINNNIFNRLKAKITGHFILYEVFQISTDKSIGEIAIARDEPDHEKALKRELKTLAKEAGLLVAALQWRAQGKH